VDKDSELRGWKARCVELQGKVERLEGEAAWLHLIIDDCGSLKAEVARLKSAAVDAARAIDGEIKCCDMMRAEVARLRSIIYEANPFKCWWSMVDAEAELLGNTIADDYPVLTFMGSGASCNVTAGDIRNMCSPLSPLSYSQNVHHRAGRAGDTKGMATC
jgi:hypothetical protein